MSSPRFEQIKAAEVLLPCQDVAAAQAFFTETLGFRLDAVMPADDPAVAILSGHGLRIRLERDCAASPGTLRLHCEDPSSIAGGRLELRAPNGTRIELVEHPPRVELPPLRAELVVTRASEGVAWTEGRAGMSYRDLIPSRLGGRFIASQIRIPTGGPVKDWVHYHRVRFQMIYCHRGWVRVVYEDQGDPFELREGDCVLQPPEIRHRVLECSDGLEVIEIGCPAEHETLADHGLFLPTSQLRPERDFGGQRFLRHEAASAPWRPSRESGFEARDIGVAAATGGLAGAWVTRRSGGEYAKSRRHQNEFHFSFLLAGSLSLHCEGRAALPLAAGDCWTVPAGETVQLLDASDDLQLLEVSLPAGPA